MKALSLPVAIALAVIMMLSLVVAEHFKPVIKLSDLGTKLDLEAVLPDRFEGWQRLDSTPVEVVNPQASVLLDKLYSQVINRIYISEAGERVMLSVAYGEDQRGELEAHKPDFCYPAQGFTVTSTQGGLLPTPYGNIPVVRMETRAGSRFEPLTYWTTVGDVAISSLFQRRIVELEYGLKGLIPDGLIFRLSSIDPDSERAFSLQGDFLQSMISQLRVQDRARIAGLKYQSRN
ncbi:EpsI family protein [Parazoarcus communis]|uniref:EpsI family protein n=1 Tax=Parazoarcus communis TaxID=41977 RepID=A0A2U8GP27_9RHOO|nr:exosortase-associated protein EpsI, B-type [Parazoarcus communis]AWI75274.1 EpsI family protein [Parazoarcus communis]